MFISCMTYKVFKKLNLHIMGFILNMADDSLGQFILSADDVERMLGTKFLGSVPLNDEIKNFNFDSIDDSLFGIVDNVANA